MRGAASWSDVIIHNISSRGLLASADSDCRPGTIVEIRRVHHVIIGRVIWRNDKYFGLRTQDRLDIDGIVTATPPAFKPGSEEAVAADRRGTGRRITATDIAAREARSRRFGAAVQFAVIAVAIGFASMLIAERAFKLLSRPLVTIGAHLDGSAGRSATGR